MSDDHHPPPPTLHIVTLGLMGTGKTVVAEAIAKRLGLAFSDNDRRLRRTVGLNAREIRETRGVRVLHKLEAQHLLDALAAPAPSVVGAAASVVEDSRCRAALRAPGVFAVWLRASAETLAARFHNEDHRPLFGDDPLQLFTNHIATRSVLFHEVSSAVVDVDGLSVAEVIAAAQAVVDAHLARDGRSVETAGLQSDQRPPA